MSDSVSSSKLIDEITKANFYPQLVAQLNKDFCLSGLPEEFSLEINSEELHIYLAEIINKLIIHHFDDYLNLLYRIDISEIQITKLANSEIEKMSYQVSYLILKRECQKVWIRNKF